MPINDRPNGGKQWGDKGKTYYGPDAEKKAAAQRKAAYAGGYKKKK